MELRYYYTTMEDDFGLKPTVIPLLEEVKRKHGVDYRALTVSGKEENEHYQLFSSRSRVLNKRTGRKVRDELASRSGNPMLFQTIAVMERDAPEFYVKGDKGCIEFLSNVLAKGEEYLQQLFERDERIQHADVIRDFKESKLVEGKFKEEFQVGVKRIEERFRVGEYTSSQYEFAKNVGAKRIDLICEAQRETWIFEAKTGFTADSVEQALGQILIYEHLFMEDNPSATIRMGAIFGTNPLERAMVGTQEMFEGIESVFARYGVRMFIKGRDFY